MRISFNWRVFGVALGLVVAAGLPGTGLFASDTQVISSVDVENSGDSTRIVLHGAEDPIYTAFMREDPPRLIIDLPDVMFHGVETPINVGDGLVDSITLGAFGDPKVSPTMARVSVALSQQAQYELLPQGKELIVQLVATGGEPVAGAEPSDQVEAVAVEREREPMPEPTPESMPEPEEAAEAVVAEPEEGEADTSAADEASVEAEPAAVESKAASASRIVKVTSREEAVEVLAEGPIDNFDSFTLGDPDRLVVDFWGAQSSVWPRRFDVESDVVSRVRMGEHTDKVRVVLDLRSPLHAHSIQPTESGVLIALEPSEDESAEGGSVGETALASAEEEVVPEASGAELDGAPASADDAQLEESEESSAAPEEESATDESPATEGEPQAEPAEQPQSESASAPPGYTYTGELQNVDSVHFESLASIDRVVVNLSGRVDAKLVEPDEATVIVELPGARIADDAERRVDTREFGGAVEMFSAFKTPEMPGEHVRIVMKRRSGARPSLVWEGNLLKIEFPRDGLASPSESAPAAPVADAASSVEQAPAVVPASIDPFQSGTDFQGPAAPAAIDLLEEGGFSREKEYKGRRISLDFKDADMGNILRLIAEVSDLNVIAGEEVSGKVTLRLVDVPWDQALDIILMTKGLGFVRIGNILRIAPLDVLQREEQARLQERRAKEKLEDLVVKLQPVNYASVKEVRGMVKRLLTPRGSVIVDNRTSTLIIKDIPAVIHEATALVKAIDTQTPQVLIEAKIVEASLDFSRALGARWGIGYNHQGGTGGNEDFRIGDASPSVLGGGAQETNFIVSNPVTNAIGTLTMGLLGLDDKLQLDLQLQAAETASKGKVISSPRVVTLDNTTATIKQGVAIRFDASDGDSVSTSFVDAVLELNVKPHITSDRSIIMQINVKRNAPQLNDIGDAVGISKNETKTEALVQDGQTMVLGGIYTVDKGEGRTKMPFLADIPVLGVAFRSLDVQDVRRELLIFVTPHVVQEAQAPL
jgi:type IV pilus assembly protein PilQ